MGQGPSLLQPFGLPSYPTFATITFSLLPPAACASTSAEVAWESNPKRPIFLSPSYAPWLEVHVGQQLIRTAGRRAHRNSLFLVIPTKGFHGLSRETFYIQIFPEHKHPEYLEKMGEEACREAG